MGKLKMTNEEKEAAVKEAAEAVAQDVGETVAEAPTDERPKPKPKPKKHRTTKTTKETGNPDTSKGDPLKGVTIDPDANYPKIVHLIVTAGSDDTRSMDDFVSQIRETLTDEASAKHVTVLMQQYAIEGQHINSHHYLAKLAELQPDDQEN